jgi:transposase
MEFNLREHQLMGSKGQLPVHPDDEITKRLAMLFEGQCEGLGAAKAAAKYGLSTPRYFQLLKLFRERGSAGLESQKPGPKANYVRTEEVVRQVIRHRFLDPDASTAVIAQKMRQSGFPVSTRSVDRVIEEFGLQKKTLSLPAQD